MLRNHCFESNDGNREYIEGLGISIHTTYSTPEECAANGYYFIVGGTL